MTKRIHDDEIEFEGDLVYFNGTPFSGVVYDLYENGQLKSEFEFEEGLPCNVCKDWYSNGQLETVVTFYEGRKFHTEIIFYENGNKKIEANYEWGIELQYYEWSIDGKLVIERKLDPQDPKSNYKILLRYRQLYDK